MFGVLVVTSEPPQDTDLYEAARLRQATLQDVHKLVRLFEQARASDTASLVTDVRAWLEHGGALVLENASGDLLCALCWREDGAGWQLDRIATLPEARGQGYGRWLMTKVEALAIRANIPTLCLSLDDKRDDLLAYYGRMGYASVREHGGRIELEKRVGGMWQFKR